MIADIAVTSLSDPIELDTLGHTVEQQTVSSPLQLVIWAFDPFSRWISCLIEFLGVHDCCSVKCASNIFHNKLQACNESKLFGQLHESKHAVSGQEICLFPGAPLAPSKFDLRLQDDFSSQSVDYGSRDSVAPASCAEYSVIGHPYEDVEGALIDSTSVGDIGTYDGLPSQDSIGTPSTSQ